MRIAVITPYRHESLDVLRRCHDSVAAQTVPAVHVMVADGNARRELDSWPIEHIVLPVAHDDYGGTPRAVGALSVTRRPFDAIQWLDADNWLQPHHLARMVQRAGRACVVTATRTLYRLDGVVLGVDTESDGHTFCDTNCLFLTRDAFWAAGVWGATPREEAIVGDRVLWRAIVDRRLPRQHCSEPTVAYVTTWANHYEERGLRAPSGSKRLIQRDGRLEMIFDP